MSNRGFFGSIPNPPKAPTNVLESGAIFFLCHAIIQIAIGAKSLDDCPRQPFIPIYLIVMGVFGLVLAVLFFLMSIKKFEDISFERIRKLLAVSLFLICLFLFCWIIAGACLNCVFGCLKPLFYIYINEGNNSQYKNNHSTNSSLQNDHKTKTVSTKTEHYEGNEWIFPIYQPNYNKNTTNVDPYCDKLVYRFALWLTIGICIVVGLVLIIVCYIIVKNYLCDN